MTLTSDAPNVPKGSAPLIPRISGGSLPAHQGLLLFLILLAGAGCLVYLARVTPLSYDGLWHLFIAKHDTWAGVFREQQSVAHPPLYFILLSLACTLGGSPLLYRAVSILAALGSVLLMWRIGRKISAHPLVPVAAAVGFALALPQMLVTVQVRSYALCIFFVLLSFYYYLDLVQLSVPLANVRVTLCFAISLTLALLCHYFAAFFLAAAMAAPLYTAALNAEYRKLLAPFFKRKTRLIFLTFVPIVLFCAYLYLGHAKTFARRLGYISQYYFDRDGPESVLAFVIRTAQNLFNLFSPIEVSKGNDFLVVLLLLVAAVSLAVCFLHPRAPLKKIARGVPLTFALAIAGGLITASLLGVYPFGGPLRQQSILYPFTVLAVITCIERLGDAFRSPRVLKAILVAGMALTAFDTSLELKQYSLSAASLGGSDVEVFRQQFPRSNVVYVDQYSLMYYFGGHHDWNWKSEGLVFPGLRLRKYLIEKDATKIVLLRDQSWWNFDFRSPRLYQTLRRTLSAEGIPRLTVFHVNQTYPENSAGAGKVNEQIRQRAAAAGMDTPRIVVDGKLVFAQFQLTEPNSSGSGGSVDNGVTEGFQSTVVSQTEGGPKLDRLHPATLLSG